MLFAIWSKRVNAVLILWKSKELVMTKNDYVGLKHSFKCWICDNVYVEDDDKLRDHCHTAERNRASTHRDCDINVKLNHKISIIFHNLKNYDSWFIKWMSYQMN